MYGLFHARKLQLHALALKLGWDAVHPRLKPDQALLRLVHARDRGQRLRLARGGRGGPRQGARLHRRLPAVSGESASATPVRREYSLQCCNVSWP